jgi:hypothetical protein
MKRPEKVHISIQYVCNCSDGHLTRLVFCAAGKHNNVSQYYLAYSHVATMALVGFGYLMTFLRRYRFGAIGYTFLVTVLVRTRNISFFCFSRHFSRDVTLLPNMDQFTTV